MNFRTCVALVASLPLLVLACSDDENGTSTPPVDAGTKRDSSVAPMPDSGDTPELDADVADTGVADTGTETDGGYQTLNGCEDGAFVDATSDAMKRILDPWNNQGFHENPNRCLRIRAGQTVTWKGSLAAHPLLPSGGTEPSPITRVGTGDETTVTFPNAGNFGYVCENHARMRGVIRVVAAE